MERMVPQIAPRVVSLEELMDSVKGIAIDRGESGEGGMKLFLSDGRVLIFDGAFLIYVGTFEKAALH